MARFAVDPKYFDVVVQTVSTDYVVVRAKYPSLVLYGSTAEGLLVPLAAITVVRFNCVGAPTCGAVLWARPPDGTADAAEVQVLMNFNDQRFGFVLTNFTADHLRINILDTVTNQRINEVNCIANHKSYCVALHKATKRGFVLSMLPDTTKTVRSVETVAAETGQPVEGTYLQWTVTPMAKNESQCRLFTTTAWRATSDIFFPVVLIAPLPVQHPPLPVQHPPLFVPLLAPVDQPLPGILLSDSAARQTQSVVKNDVKDDEPPRFSRVGFNAYVDRFAKDTGPPCAHWTNRTCQKQGQVKGGECRRREMKGGGGTTLNFLDPVMRLISRWTTPTATLNATPTVTLNATPTVTLNATPTVALNATPTVTLDATAAPPDSEIRQLIDLARPASIIAGPPGQETTSTLYFNWDETKRSPACRVCLAVAEQLLLVRSGLRDTLTAFEQFVAHQFSTVRPVSPEKECCCCMAQDTSVMFCTCGHICTCHVCAVQLTVCPLCRTSIVARIDSARLVK